MPASPGLSFNTVRGADGWDIRYDLKEELGKLMSYLIEGFNVLHDYPPAIILSFDEAHTLTEVSTDDVDGLWSRFSELRRALRVIHSFPCFSVFLSTTGKVQQFTPDALHDMSTRLQEGLLSLIAPFCELGFDQLAEKAISGKVTTGVCIFAVVYGQAWASAVSVLLVIRWTPLTRCCQVCRSIHGR